MRTAASKQERWYIQQRKRQVNITRVHDTPTAPVVKLILHLGPQQVTINKYEGGRAANGLFEGEGQAEFTSGNRYSGSFEHGQMHGQGEYVWTDGLVYTGDFVNNRIMGTGVS